MARQRGFTLLEMMVVMVLLGLVTTLALPAMQRWHDAVQHKAQAAEIIDALRAAGFNAGANRREIVVDAASFRQLARPADAPASEAASSTGSAAGKQADQVEPGTRVVDRLALTLPAGWHAKDVDDIRFLANGLCRPGSLLLRTDRGDTVRIDVRGPLCGVELAQQTGTASR